MSSPSRNELLTHLVRESHLLGGRLVLSHQGRADVLGLNPTDLLCLELIGGEEPVTAGYLAEVLQLTTGAITGVLDRLERAGFIRRQRDPDDRRRVLVRVSPQRQRELAQLIDPLAAALDQVAESWSEDDLRRALDFVTQLHPALAAESARLRPRSRQPAAGGPGGVLSVPAGDTRHVRLEVSLGLVEVTVEADPDLPDLVRAAFGDPQPRLELIGDTVQVRSKGWSLFRGWTGSGTLTLNAGFRWSVALRGGMAHIKADLRRLDLARLELGGGMSQVDVSLPAPAGTVSIDVSGGASSFNLDRPAGAPLRIQVRGGASNFRVDSFEAAAIGDTHWQTPDFDAATDRYDISVRGGADHLVVTTR